MRVARQSRHPKIATEEIVVQMFCRAGMEDNGTYWPMFGGYRATVRPRRSPKSEITLVGVWLASVLHRFGRIAGLTQINSSGSN
jgi:hypothetical protein